MEELKSEAPRHLLQDGSSIVKQLLAPPNIIPVQPLIICFHGSGSNPTRAWSILLSQLTEQRHPAILVERPKHLSNPETHAAALLTYLNESPNSPPYILLAHSYGGFFAKHFALTHPDKVSALILVETGKAPEPTRYARTKSLLDKPVLVISGDSLIANRIAVQDALNNPNLTRDRKFELNKEMKRIDEMSDHDLALEKGQLKVSTIKRHFVVPGTGHHVICDKPGVVLNQLEWVMEALDGKQNHSRFDWRSLLNRILLQK